MKLSIFVCLVLSTFLMSVSNIIIDIYLQSQLNPSQTQTSFFLFLFPESTFKDTYYHLILLNLTITTLAMLFYVLGSQSNIKTTKNHLNFILFWLFSRQFFHIQPTKFDRFILKNKFFRTNSSRKNNK